MIPILLRGWPYIAIGLLVISNGFTFRLWQSEREDHITYRAQIASMANAVREENARLARIQLQNLSHLRVDYEAKLPSVRSDAVAAYLRRVPVPAARGDAVPAPSANIKVDDGAVKECRPDSALIQDAADDALKLSAWQEYGRQNHLPVQE